MHASRQTALLEGTSMGTTWSMRLGCGHAPDTLGPTTQAVLDRIVDQMSTWDADSAITRLNHAPRGWYQIPDEFFEVLQAALGAAEESRGAYDPTLGRLTSLWGFGPEGSVQAPPEEAEIARALASGGWRKTALNTEHRGVWQPGGLHFDLSSIAKGYGVDAMGQVLDEHGITDYLVELGGELKARGHNAEGLDWIVEIESPVPHTDGLPVALRDCAIATSGEYRRHIWHKGRRYGHTLDPRSGRPVAHALESVSVLHDSCMLADALATALQSMGPRLGLQHAREHGIAAVFMIRSRPDDLAVEWTAPFQERAQGRRPA